MAVASLLAAAAPRPAPARSPAPPSPAPARARAAVEGGSTATVAGRVTRGAARERGWGTQQARCISEGIISTVSSYRQEAKHKEWIHKVAL